MVQNGDAEYAMTVRFTPEWKEVLAPFEKSYKLVFTQGEVVSFLLHSAVGWSDWPRTGEDEVDWRELVPLWKETYEMLDASHRFDLEMLMEEHDVRAPAYRTGRG